MHTQKLTGVKRKIGNRMEFTRTALRPRPPIGVFHCALLWVELCFTLPLSAGMEVMTASLSSWLSFLSLRSCRWERPTSAEMTVSCDSASTVSTSDGPYVTCQWILRW